MVKLVLENGANPDLPGDEYRGRTPLHLAISLANIPIISTILVEKGAKINSTDERGLTALHVAAQKGSLKAVKNFVQLGADIHCTDHKGRTPL
ncbi:hypothetical protein K456DRAFT_1861461, partial [Colletotrichum gloeosporioides 23]